MRLLYIRSNNHTLVCHLSLGIASRTGGVKAEEPGIYTVVVMGRDTLIATPPCKYTRAKSLLLSDWSRLTVRPALFCSCKNATETRGEAARPPLPTSSPPNKIPVPGMSDYVQNSPCFCVRGSCVWREYGFLTGKSRKIRGRLENSPARIATRI